jgi:indole-3-glycerol phosphate synthase
MISEGSFSNAIKAENGCGFTAVIPDIKCVSPKEGDLLRGRDPVETAAALVSYGAAVLSVVTEGKHFGGSMDLLRAVAKKTGVPVLRKDFITNEKDLHETVECGASAVLLICSMLDGEQLGMLYREALRLGLEPLVETHNEAELELAKRLGARLVGINNKNITTLEKDEGGPARTAALAGMAPKETLLISESGIHSPDDARLAASAGANALLVGTALWQAADMEAAYKSLRVSFISCALR